VEHRANRRAWEKLDQKSNHTVVLEQYLLAACIDYHRGRVHSPYREIGIDYLFSSMDDAFFSDKATQLGYTHLIANAKQDPHVAGLLERRVAENWPDQYERCVSCAGRAARNGLRRSSSRAARNPGVRVARPW